MARGVAGGRQEVDDPAFLANVDLEEHFVGTLWIGHLDLRVAAVSAVDRPTQTPAPEPRYVRPSFNAGPMSGHRRPPPPVTTPP